MEVRIVKVTTNNTAALIYIPKAVREMLGLQKGTYVKLSVEGKRLVVEPLELTRDWTESK